MSQGPHEELQEVRSVFITGGIANYAAGVTARLPAGFPVLLRVDANQNFNDLRVRAEGRDTAVLRAVYRIGTPYTCFVRLSPGSSQQHLVISGTPAGACDMNIFVGKLKPQFKECEPDG